MQNINLLAQYNKPVILDLGGLTFEQQDTLLRSLRANGFRVVHRGERNAH